MPNPSHIPPASSETPNQDKGHGCSLHLQNKGREPKFRTWVYQRWVIISVSKSRCQTQVRNLKHLPKPQIRTLSSWMFFAPLESRWRAKIQNVGVSKTSDHISVKIKMPNPSQEPPASLKAINQDFRDIYVLCTLKSRWCQNLKHGCMNN